MKKLTQEQIAILHKDVQSTLKTNGWSRKGQAYFNCLWMDYPELANSVRGTDADPFYNDDKIPAFLQAITKK